MMPIHALRMRTAAAAGAWTPASLGSTLQVWYDIDQETGYTNGQQMTTMTNRAIAATYDASGGAGNDCKMVTGALNGKRVMDCSTPNNIFGTFDIAGTPLSGASAGTKFQVFKNEFNPTQGLRHFVGVVNQFSNQGATANWPYIDGSVQENFGSTISRSFTPSPAIDFSSAYRIVAVRAAANDWKAWVDGVLVQSSASNTVNFGTGTRQIGWYPNGSDNFKFEGWIAEIAVCDTALSDADMNLFGNYLKDKFGISWTNI